MDAVSSSENIVRKILGMEKNYKRKFRERDDATKIKISNSLRNKSKSFSHRAALSQALKSYWKTVESKNNADVKPFNNDGEM